MAFPYEIKDRLVAQGVGVYGTNIFIGTLALIPAGDGPYLSIIETGGTGAARTHNGSSTERPGAQILVRAKTMPLARVMLQAAYDALGGADGLHNIDLGAVRYLSITARQTITDIGTDGAGRVMVSLNFDFEKKPS